MAVTGKPKLLRELNSRLIIETIRECPSLSRADLARELGLSQPTVSLIIEALVSQGILLETGTGNSSGGRRPILLAINPDYRYVAGVDLSKSEAGIVLGNLRGDLVAQAAVGFDLDDEGKAVLTRAAEAIKELCRANRVGLELLAAVAVAVPGIYDQTTGLIKRVARSFDWEGLVPEEEFKKHFACPILVKNDVNTGAWGEFWRRKSLGVENLAYVSVGLGVGAGIILRGQLLEGCHGMAGEIGFMSLGREAMEARYSRYGHLETMASAGAVVERAREIAAAGRPGLLSGLSRGESGRVDFRLVCRAAALHDEDARRLLEDMAVWVGLGVANLQNVLDLELIAVGGEVLAAGDVFLDRLRETVAAIVCNPPEIVFSAWQEKAVLTGAMAAALGQVYDSELIKLESVSG